MKARIRRLYADYHEVMNEFAGSPFVTIRPLQGDPPEKYMVTFKGIRGLRWDPARKRPVETKIHQAEIYLHSEYPREKPKCVLRTEIFHPNFGSFICIGDHWAAGETLVDVIIQIGDMIQFKEYNVKSPLNATAARWARQNEHLLPIDNVDLYQKDPEITLHLEADAQEEEKVDNPAAESGEYRMRFNDGLEINLNGERE